jgi:hypothetical protein
MQGVKAFDTSALREAVAAKLVARVAEECCLPWFSPYYSFSRIPLSFDKVFLETRPGSRSFCPWKTDKRESFPSVFKTPASNDSFFLPNTPRPLRLMATLSISEQSNVTMTDFLRDASVMASWTLAQTKELIVQLACAIISY